MYLELFLIYFKIGAYTLGGGYAMLPLVGMIGASLLSVAGSAFPAAAGIAQSALAAVLLAAILAAHWKKVHPILLIVGSAVVGIAAGYAGLLPGV